MSGDFKLKRVGGRSLRNLSGIYFRHQDETGEWISVCFEDLPPEEQAHKIDGMEPEFRKSMILKMSEVVREMGDKFGLYKE